jgi:tetratricopeptide (TPR) repeat protein
VTENRNRWVKILITGVGLIAFIGVGIFPFIQGIVNSNPPGTDPTTPVPTQTVNAADRAELEQQAESYELFLQSEPDNETALEKLLQVRLELEDLPGSIEVLEKLVLLKPEQTNYAVLLAQAKEQTGDPEAAAQVYRQIINAQPGNINALDGMVKLLIAENRPEAAIGVLQDTLKKAPQVNQIEPNSIDVVSVQTILGQVYAQQERYAEAIAVYDEAMKVDEKDFRPVLGKALVLRRQGNNEEATQLFNVAVELAPSQYRDQIKQLAAPPTVPVVPAPDPSPTPETSE